MPRGFVNRRDRFRWDNVHFPDGENPLSSDSVTYDGQDLTSTLDRLKEGVCFVEATPGASVTFTTADAAPLRKLTADVTLVQSGSGDPAPDNVRTITGWSSCTITVTDGVTPTTYTISFGDAGTVYGGTLDVLTGVLTVDKAYFTFNEALYYGVYGSDHAPLYYMTIPEGYDLAKASIASDPALSCNVFNFTTGTSATRMKDNEIRTNDQAAITTFYFRADSFADLEAVNTFLSSNPLQVVAPLKSAKTFQLTPQEVETLVGSNTVSASTGDITALTYQDTFTNEVNLIWQAISDLDARVSALEGNKSITPPPDDQKKAVTEEEPAEEIVEEQPVKKTTRKKTTE